MARRPQVEDRAQAFYDAVIVRVVYSNRVEGFGIEAWKGLQVPKSVPATIELLQRLEANWRIGPGSNWTLSFVCVEDQGQLIGLAPAFIRHRSDGEAVQDSELRELYDRMGVAYYPKVVVGWPYLPFDGARLLVAPGNDRAAVWEIMAIGLEGLVRHHGASGVHVHLCSSDEADFLCSRGFARRAVSRQEWRNLGFRTFEGWREQLASAGEGAVQAAESLLIERKLVCERIRGPLSRQRWSELGPISRNSKFLPSDLADKLPRFLAENLRVLTLRGEDGVLAMASVLLKDQRAMVFDLATAPGESKLVETLLVNLIKNAIEEEWQRIEFAQKISGRSANLLWSVAGVSCHRLVEDRFQSFLKSHLERDRRIVISQIGHRNRRGPLKRPVWE